MMPPEIHRTKLDVADRELIRQLPRIARLFDAVMSHSSHAVGLGRTELRLLGRLREHDYRVADLAEELEIGLSRLAAAATVLTRQGLIEQRLQSRGERRIVPIRVSPAGRPISAHLDEGDDPAGALLRLTPAGRALVRTVQGRAAAAISTLGENVDAEEQEALLFGLGGAACGPAGLDTAPPMSCGAI
jgi:DNA-binding MarR family transcriptional regulator